MSYCYTPVESYTFFFNPSECNDLNHDLRIHKGDLSNKEDKLISSIIIQLHTDARVNGERGWWGDQFLEYPIGIKTWSLLAKSNTTYAQVAYEAFTREALQPFIDQGLIDSYELSVVQTIDGFEGNITIFKDNQEFLRTVI